MYARLIYLISLVLVVSLAGTVQAKSTYFRNNDPNDSLWSTEGNWDNGLPSLGDWAKIRGGEPGATIASDVGSVQKIAVGYDEGSSLTVVDGGRLHTDQDVVFGRNSDATLYMMGGLIDCSRDFEMGYNNPATAKITGGTILVGRDVELPKSGNGQETHIDLHGGTLIVGDDLAMSEGGTMDIRAGVMILDANVIDVVQGFVDSGWITAYNGDGTLVMDYDVTNPGQTTVTALHKFNPSPADGGIGAPGQLELSWTLPEDVIKVDVWFSNDIEKIFQEDPSALIVDQAKVTSVVVQTQVKTQYYWAVDTYVGDEVNDPSYGHVFQFLADNVPPEVDPGEDVVAWFENGSVDVTLAGAVIDSDPTTTLWTVVSQPDDPNNPDAAIADPAALNTTITLSALGEYVLQLEADDGEYQDADTLTINVYSDQCAAAQAQPGWTPSTADINLDCIVDQLDLDILTENWLKCNTLDCTDPEHDHSE